MPRERRRAVTAIDTNVLIRILTHDDPAQTEKALEVLEGDLVCVPVTVMLETEWVLRHAYSLPRPQITRVFRQLADSSGILLDEHEAIANAIALHDTGLDFADALHLSLSRGKADRFCTFDKASARGADDGGSVPVVLL